MPSRVHSSCCFCCLIMCCCWCLNLGLNDVSTGPLRIFTWQKEESQLLIIRDWHTGVEHWTLGGTFYTGTFKEDPENKRTLGQNKGLYLVNFQGYCMWLVRWNLFIMWKVVPATVNTFLQRKQRKKKRKKRSAAMTNTERKYMWQDAWVLPCLHWTKGSPQFSSLPNLAQMDRLWPGYLEDKAPHP